MKLLQSMKKRMHANDKAAGRKTPASLSSSGSGSSSASGTMLGSPSSVPKKSSASNQSSEKRAFRSVNSSPGSPVTGDDVLESGFIHAMATASPVTFERVRAESHLPRSDSTKLMTSAVSSPAPTSRKEVVTPVPSTKSNPFSELPNLKDAAPNDRLDLFRKKLKASATVYDFNQQNTCIEEKESKRQALLETVEYVNSTRNCFVEDDVMRDLVDMVSANIFRTLPPSTSNMAMIYDPEEDEPTLESSWPHLQIVYEIFLRFVVSIEVEPKQAKRYIDQQFVLKLLDLFNSEDPRERDYLKTILHRIYGKIMALRSFIRKAIQHVFFKIIYETETHHGISELLEILGSIINGFALPLKEEHKLFLEKSLIPLHKAKGLNTFYQQLSYCMTQFVEKDSRLAEPIISGMLRFWPVTNTPKEVLFLNELEDVLELVQPPEFQKMVEPLFRRLAECIQSPHFQVAERVLFLWNNDALVKMINQNRQVVFPLVISALYKNSKHHWNNTVQGLTYNVSKILAEADPSLFDECSEKYAMEETSARIVEEDRDRIWEDLKAEYERNEVITRTSGMRGDSTVTV